MLYDLMFQSKHIIIHVNCIIYVQFSFYRATDSTTYQETPYHPSFHVNWPSMSTGQVLVNITGAAR